MVEAAALPVDMGLTWTNCRWIFRTKLLHLQLACSCWVSRSRGHFLWEDLTENGTVKKRLKFNKICDVSGLLV